MTFLRATRVPLISRHLPGATLGVALGLGASLAPALTPVAWSAAQAQSPLAKPAAPAGAATKPPADEAETRALISKLNAYVALMNRTMRASDSVNRYASWVNMRTGPTGKERVIYGMYSLYDVRTEIGKAKDAVAEPPKLTELDAAMPDYIAAYEALAPVVAEAERYYTRKDYTDDAMAGGKALHARLAPLIETYRKERARADALLGAEKARADLAELALIEQTEGRTARWHVANVMLHARRVVDLFPSQNQPVIALPPFEQAIQSYAATVKDMDAYAAEHPNSFFVFASRPGDFLGKLRSFREKLQASKGDVRKGAARDLEWLVRDYNMMVSTARNATQFNR